MFRCSQTRFFFKEIPAARYAVGCVAGECSVHENALCPPLINWKQMSDRDPDGEQGNFNVFWTDTSVLINRFATVSQFFSTPNVAIHFSQRRYETNIIFFWFNYNFRLCLRNFISLSKLETSDTQSWTRLAMVKIFQNNQARLNVCPPIRKQFTGGITTGSLFTLPPPCIF